ncbi:MAG: ABC transporter ATP-binding protein/permease [Methanomassiliicoccales archaeon]|nr:ABC transporter ATP-binding protein/permease [Methanomassiliicoccales archaeon]
MLALTKGHRSLFAVAIAFLALASAMTAIPFLFIYRAIETIMSGTANLTDFSILIALILITYFVSYVFLFLGYYLTHVMAFRIIHEVRMELAERMTRLPIGTLEGLGFGQLENSLNSNMERLELFLAHHFPEMVSIFIVPIAMGLFMFILDWKMAVTVIAPIMVGICVILYFRKDWGRTISTVLQMRSRLSSTILELIQGIKVFRMFRVDLKRSRFQCALSEFKEKYLYWYERTTPPLDIYHALVTSTLVFVIPVGGWLYTNGELAIETFIFFIIMSVLFGKLMLRIYHIYSFYNEEFVCMERINLIRASSVLPERDGGLRPKDGSIEMRSVHFSYGEEEVIRGLDLKVDSGKKLAIVGPSGAGKTTITRLITRAYDVQSGQVLVGGVDVREIPFDELMRHISVVFQDIFLFNDTVMENIRIGRPAASDEEVVEAARKARCDEFIRGLEHGYETKVGDRGMRLSGGEKQRISIARSILKDAPILILDEATVFIDPENEGFVQEALAELTENRTVIMIAHRLSTITDVDDIVYIDEGKVAEEGRFEDLVQAGSKFSFMWKRFECTLNWQIRA